MANTRSVFSISLNGKEVKLELDEALKEKIVELIKEEYSRADLRRNTESRIVSDYYEISIKKIG
jgi:hypothetical protein